jgi:hypothetical protein
MQVIGNMPRHTVAKHRRLVVGRSRIEAAETVIGAIETVIEHKKNRIFWQRKFGFFML